MIYTPLSTVINSLLLKHSHTGGRLTNLNVREREGMNPILRDCIHTVAVIKDPEYTDLLIEAGRLQEQLAIAVLILDNLPGLSIDTLTMKLVLKQSGWVGE